MNISNPVASSVRTYCHWLNGRETAATTFIDRISPETGQVVARFAAGSKADAKAAITATRAAFDSGIWSGKTSAERSRILTRWAALVEQNATRLALIEVEEAGKTWRVAKGDLDGTVDLINYAAALGLTESGEAYFDIGDGLNGFVVREPVGVVGAIVPWNFPTIIFAQKVPFALAAGCCVVVKPSEFTSGTAVEMARLATEAGLPDGVLNVVTGYGMPVGQEFTDSPDVDMISFTGSTRTGKAILEGQKVNFKRIALELGGKSAAIVLNDADIDAAVEGVMFSIFFHQGQVCCAGSRLLVQDEIADTFIRRLAQRAGSLQTGPLAEAATDIGPLISPEHLRLVQSLVEKAKLDGAEITCGGAVVRQSDLAGAPTQTMLPTILDKVTPSMSVFSDEIFGPVLTVTRFSTPDEAIRLANTSSYGLAGSVWSTDIPTALHIAKSVRTGTIEINTCLEGQPQLPFGGFKASGLGREKGKDGLAEFTETKTIGLRTKPRKSFFAAR